MLPGDQPYCRLFPPAGRQVSFRLFQPLTESATDRQTADPRVGSHLQFDIFFKRFVTHQAHHNPLQALRFSVHNSPPITLLPCSLEEERRPKVAPEFFERKSALIRREAVS
jgi:hypothetical protein